MTNNGDGTYSYQLPIAIGRADRSYSLPVTAVDAAGNVGYGPVSVFVMDTAGAIYLDNEDIIQSYPDNWTRSELRSDAYSGSAVYSYNQDGVPEFDLTATWKPNITNAGSYNVYAWLNNMGFASANAVYEVQHNGGTTAVPVSQRSGPTGGGWVLLGMFAFDQGETSITLSGTDVRFGNRLYVDAIKLAPAP